MNAPPLMRGATPVRMGVAKYLKDAFPVRRKMALASWKPTLPVGELPEIMVYNPFDNITLPSNSSPIVGVDAKSASEFRRTDTLDGADEYRAKYNVVVTLWAYSLGDAVGASMGPQRASAIRIRDDLTAILVSCLLDRPSLATETLLLDEGSMEVNYLDSVPTPNNSQRYFSGSQIAFDVQSDEYQIHSPLNDITKPNVFDVTAEVRNLTVDGSYSNIGKYK